MTWKIILNNIFLFSYLKSMNYLVSLCMARVGKLFHTAGCFQRGIFWRLSLNKIMNVWHMQM